ncbi:MAG: SGNH/GDSL hydrolase family protein [Paludibacter sp.]|nr:SGNH/GDSL hydrolase family protein [Paludibacter sp.]
MKRKYLLLVAVQIFVAGSIFNNIYGQKNNLLIDTIGTKSSIKRDSYIETRGGLTNSYLQFTKNKTGRVAFLGGSITAMSGWREKVCNYLTKRFPDTKFEFIQAGIPSTGSTPGAFRLEKDVLSKGKIDLLFEEAAVNDADQTANSSVRGMEGIVRHTLKTNSNTDIVLMYFVDQKKINDYNAGTTPLVIASHDKVAVHYNLPSINLAKEVTDRINAKEFTWENDFKNLHPSPFGHELYFQSIRLLLENCWVLSETKTKMVVHKIPNQIDPYSYTTGIYADIQKAKEMKGWAINEKWAPTDGITTRKGYVDVPMLISTISGSIFNFSFKGSAIGVCVVAGPDAGIIEYSIDGGAYQSKDLFTAWSDKLYMNQYLLFSDSLPSKKHQLSIRISENKNEKSIGHTCQIVNFLVNKSK